MARQLLSREAARFQDARVLCRTPAVRGAEQHILSHAAGEADPRLARASTCELSLRAQGATADDAQPPARRLRRAAVTFRAGRHNSGRPARATPLSAAAQLPERP